MENKVLGLIPARGGSKGIPRKNLSDLDGKKLIHWTIEAGSRAKSLDRLIVSTDSIEIAEFSESVGADVPFMRPREFATDASLQISVIIDALKKLESLGEFYTHVVLLQPTCPFRSSEDIDRAWDLYVSSNAGTLISVQSVNFIQPSNLYRSDTLNKLSVAIELQPLDPDSMTSSGTSRQNFSEMWWRNGAIYIFQSSLLRETQHLYHSPLVGFEMPWYRSINIDTVEDLRHAEIIARNLHS